ncbi:Bax inhibitor-1/YccA family protein [Halocella sp. SP3-1]|uniref:Bax inhibitor-1/YccA family protein n=1 Tax=Halocella sp. SP3-1 TaxID=2382161 RepID=UPI00256FC2DF|nr:Bax inhibitor-1/YccA family protein [Halocella sp. SP3-1]
MVKVYGWMFLALMITAVVALITISSESILMMIFSNQVVFFGLLIGELVLVWILSRRIYKMSVPTAMITYLLYSVINGLTLSCIFLAYTMGSIAGTFFVTALIFGIMALYGYFTDKDLTSAGNICLMGLIGIIIASLVNMFLNSTALYWIITYAGVIIFTALAAYDTQKIKQMNVIGDEGTAQDKKQSIIGALILYLDFINLFIMLLRIFGRKRN